MRVVPSDLPEVLIIEPDVFHDGRGFFFEGYHARKYAALGIADVFVQDNQSRSIAGTVRGLHLQVRRPQAKLIRVVLGEILDVAVDVRRGSPTFGRWVGVTLSASTSRQLYIPGGFAHGFSVLSPVADVIYKCSDFYDPGDELGLAWDDPELGIDWRVTQPILSDRDRHHLPLRALTDRLPLLRTEL